MSVTKSLVGSVLSGIGAQMKIIHGDQAKNFELKK